MATNKNRTIHGGHPDLSQETLQKLADQAQDLHRKGYSRAYIEAEYARWEREALAAPATAPSSMTAQEIAAYNLEAACSGAPQLVRDPDRAGSHRSPSAQQVAGAALERACGFGGDDPIQDYAPRGISERAFAQLCLDRACKGQPPISRHPDDSDGED